MMSEIDWSNNAVMMLVKEYERRPELWDKEHNMYRVQTAKNAAWSALAHLFSCDITDLRKKLNSLLASHRRERTKVKEGGRSTWFLYPHMKFLQGHVKSPDDEPKEITTEHYEQVEILDHSYDIQSDGTHVASDNEQEMEVMIKHEPKTQKFTHRKFVDTASHGKKKLTRTLKRKPRRQNTQTNVQQEMYSKVYVDSRILEVQRMMKKDSLIKKDDCDTYVEYIASTLRKHDNKTQCMIKQAINNILFEQEMNKYENPLDTDIVAEILDASDD